MCGKSLSISMLIRASAMWYGFVPPLTSYAFASAPGVPSVKIAIVGTGYVGLVAGACFAENGNDVICVDKDAAKVRLLRRGRMPIYEPGLEEMVERNTAEKRLVFTTVLTKAVRQSSIVFIAVGTPQGEDGSADLQHVQTVARDVGRAMNGYKVIVDKSTVPVGTAARVRDIIRRETTHPFSVVSN